MVKYKEIQEEKIQTKINFPHTTMLKIKNTIFKHITEKKFLRSTKDGTSLLIGLGLTTIIVLVSIGVTTVVISSIRESANVTGANKAYYAAEGALEKGLLVNQDKGAGYSGGDKLKDFPATYTISGQVNPDNAYSIGKYGIPTPGTGTAGNNCDALNPDIKLDFNYDPVTGKYSYVSGTDPAIDNPCNWNKIKVGESVSIPLYVTKIVGGTEGISNPKNLGLTSLKIRVRTACKNGKEFCAPSDRYKLYFDTSTPSTIAKTNDTVMSWQISAENIGGNKTYTFSPNQQHSTSCTDDGGYKGRCEPSPNSEIYESQINYLMSTDATVLSATSGEDLGIDNTNTLEYISDFLNDTTDYLIGESLRPTASDAINKPILKLSVIHSLQDSPTTTIPYLEYQILADASTEAPTDTSQTITAQGFSGTFKQVLEVKNPQESGLLEYVIQQ